MTHQVNHSRVSSKGNRFSAGSRKIRIIKRAKVDPEKVKVFKYLNNNLDVETGGNLDFEKGKLERMSVDFGSNDGLDIVNNDDWEGDWHTHVNPVVEEFLPSDDDIYSFVTNPTKKVSVIWWMDNTLMLNKTPKFDSWVRGKSKSQIKSIIKSINNKSENDVSSFVDKMKDNKMSVDDVKKLTEQYNNRLNKLGLVASVNTRNKELQEIPLEVVI